MMDFLSDVFEFDVDTESDTITNGPLVLKLIESGDRGFLPERDTGITFAFHLRKNEQMKEILNKYNFFLYRKSQDPNNEKFKFQDDCRDGRLKIRDFDGRTWQFDLLSLEASNEL